MIPSGAPTSAIRTFDCRPGRVATLARAEVDHRGAQTLTASESYSRAMPRFYRRRPNVNRWPRQSPASKLQVQMSLSRVSVCHCSVETAGSKTRAGRQVMAFQRLSPPVAHWRLRVGPQRTTHRQKLSEQYAGFPLHGYPTRKRCVFQPSLTPNPEQAEQRIR